MDPRKNPKAQYPMVTRGGRGREQRRFTGSRSHFDSEHSSRSRTEDTEGRRCGHGGVRGRGRSARQRQRGVRPNQGIDQCHTPGHPLAGIPVHSIHRGRGGKVRPYANRPTPHFVPVDKKEKWTPPIFSVNEIKALSRLEPKELVQTIDNQVKAFQVTLEQKRIAYPEVMEAVLKILAILAHEMQQADSEVQETACKVLAEVLSDRCAQFHTQLTIFVSKLPTQMPTFKSNPNAQQLCNLFKALLTVLPRSSWSCLPVDQLLHSVQRLPGRMSTTLQIQAKELVQLRDHISETQREQKLQIAAISETWDNSEYRQIQILPTQEEICIGNPPTKLRANIIRGCYEDWMHYYDVQFRLLREDFIAPLRRGIKEFQEGVRGRNLRDVKVYNDVTIVTPVCTKSGICFELRFNASLLQRCNWEHSKRLLFGSLLCLSSVNFTDVVLFATVTDRDPKKLALGSLQVQFEDSIEVLPYCRNKTSFIMVESSAYFEASRHILKSLQTAEVDTMPFTEYLIKGNCSSVSAPKYLPGGNESSRRTHRNEAGLSGVSDETTDEGQSTSAGQRGGRRSTRQNDTAVYDLSCLYGAAKSKKRKLEFNILDKDAWPTAGKDEIEPDQSQMEAIQMALTQEIAVIQGPPGTGKTYIGLKIVESLLANRKAWDPRSASPILVVCYTNHALDQFLEGILKMWGIGWGDSKFVLDDAKLVRIGSRSKNETVNQFNIRNVAKHQHLPPDLYHELRDLERILKDPRQKPEKALEKQPNPYKDVYKSWKMVKYYFNPSQAKLLSNQVLRKVVDPEHYYQLSQLVASQAKSQKGHEVEIWLGLWVEYQTQVPVKGKRKPKEVGKPASIPIDVSPQKLPNKPNKQGRKKNFKVSLEIPQSREESDPVNKEMELVEIEGEATIEGAARMLSEDLEDFKPVQPTEDSATESGDSADDDTNDEDEQDKPKIDHKFPWEEMDQESDEEESDSADDSNEEKGKVEPPPVMKTKTEWKMREDANRVIRAHIFKSFMSEEEVKGVKDVNTLSLRDRWRLYNYWTRKRYEFLEMRNVESFHEFNYLCWEYKETQHKADEYALETANVIGMTTTGAAKYQHILHLVKPKIVIVEEAAEVLESHIVSALNAGTQHLILIGDHKQLRPKPNEYKLAKDYNLDVSLFERLVRNGFPHATLEIQHRMRPEISRLVCPHIYDRLINHETVEMYGDVKGVCKNLFFIHHEFSEQEDSNLTSHSNDHEAGFIVALCRYLLQQGYEPSQITILTPYVGQLLRIRKLMPKSEFGAVRVTAVDNFQGEENDIILLTLVRSNEKGKIGFLKEDNRVCVSLSRAKKGFYCIGNFRMLREHSALWERIMSDMDSRGNLGDALSVQCCNHPESKFEAKQPKDFRINAPNGGCLLPCNYRLPCGHSCVGPCHPTHDKYECKKECARKCKEGHPCQYKHMCCAQCLPCRVEVKRLMPDCEHEQLMQCHKDPSDVDCIAPCDEICENGHRCEQQCFEECKPCMVLLEKTLPCGHVKQLHCHVDPSCHSCKVLLEKTLPCGHVKQLHCHVDPSHYLCKVACEKTCKNSHPCKKLCSQPCGSCHVLVEKQIPKCGHMQEIPCNVDPQSHICTKSCKKFLSCGHQCSRMCGEACSQGYCTKPCKTILSCGHQCSRMCGKPCLQGYCNELVEAKLKCGHTKDIPCNQKKSHMLTFAFGYERQLICDKPCKKQLPCGHPCVALCKEPCTSKCMETVEKHCPGCDRVIFCDCHKAQVPTFNPCKRKCQKRLACGHKCKKRCGRECNCNVKMRRVYPCGHTVEAPCLSTPLTFPCKENCSQVLACGHLCSGECGKCYLSRLHQPCPYDVKVQRFCGHGAKVPCQGLSDSCSLKMTISCAHYSSSAKCLPQYTPCVQPCAWNCQHYRCSKLCHEICDRPICNERCEERLRCRHLCVSVCGEPCIKICPQCNPEKFKEKLRLPRKKKGVTLKRDQLYIQLECGDIFPVEFLDRYMEPKTVSDKMVTPKQCPTCHKNITLSYRYGNAAKRALTEVNMVSGLVVDESDISREVLMAVTKLNTPEIPAVKASLAHITDNTLSYRRRYRARGEKCLAHCFVNSIYLLQNVKKYFASTSSPLKSELIHFSETFAHLTFPRKSHPLCILSQQLLTDFKSEQHRVSLTLQLQIIKMSGDLPPKERALASTEKYLESLEENHLLRVSDEDFEKYSRQLSHIHPNALKIVCENLRSIEAPPDMKGSWFRCLVGGHYYCKPPRVQDYTCPQCV